MCIVGAFWVPPPNANTGLETVGGATKRADERDSYQCPYVQSTLRNSKFSGAPFCIFGVAVNFFVWPFFLDSELSPVFLIPVLFLLRFSFFIDIWRCGVLLSLPEWFDVADRN